MGEPQMPDASALSRVIAVVNGKGGVLKTSIVANVAGCLAREQRVLVVDLDISGNLKLDLGMAASPEDDRGRSIADAVWYGDPLRIVSNVREDLDLVFGGRGLSLLTGSASASALEELPTGSIATEFATRLAEVAGDYDVVLLDCPPGDGLLQDMALAAARWVLIPTRTDPASWDGFLQVGPRVKRARELNPDLDYLGAVITAHNPQASRVMGNTRARLEEVGETVPLFDATIRYSEAAAHDCRVRGQLVNELAVDAATNRTERLQALTRRRDDNVIVMPGALAGTADSLASDYLALSAEICQRLVRAENGDTTPIGVEA